MRPKVSVVWSGSPDGAPVPTLRAWPPRSITGGGRRSRRGRDTTRLLTAEALVRGDVVGDRYRLGERLARGGMGMVWAATDERTGEAVVVKTMKLGLDTDDEAVQRFRLEAELLAGIECPHIVRYLDEGVVGGAPYLVLERLWGEDLAGALARGRLPLDDAARILDQVGRALVVAHARGIVHRDIKPGNIFLARQDELPIVKLLDFGVAKLREGGRMHTGAGRAVGSPSFMSPEQVGGGAVDDRSDLFALGAVLYACVTGRVPFQGQTLKETFQRTLSGSFALPSRVEPTLPPTLDDFFAVALAVEPDRRFPDAASMTACFGRAIESARRATTQPSPLVAPPPASR